MKKKVVFFLFALAGGGAERTVINIINNLDENKYDITLMLGTNKNSDYINLIDNNVDIVELNCSKVRYSLFKLRRQIIKEKPDLLFSTLNPNNIMLLLANILTLKKTPIIVRETNNRTQSGSVTKLNKFVTRIFYNRFATKVIALSKGVKKDLTDNFGIKENKISVVYNPVEVDKIEILSQESVDDIKKNSNEKYIISVGRLVKQKDFITLLKAFKIITENVNSKLILLGKGPLETELKKVAREMGVEERVIFLGFKDNPYKYMRFADVFILSSKWEGFGHVIVESMASGTPVISTNCNSGPSEIISSSEYGMLVPVEDSNEMAKSTINLLGNDKLKETIEINSHKRARDFDVEKIVKEYEVVFKETIEK